MKKKQEKRSRFQLPYAMFQDCKGGREKGPASFSVRAFTLFYGFLHFMCVIIVLVMRGSTVKEPFPVPDPNNFSYTTLCSPEESGVAITVFDIILCISLGMTTVGMIFVGFSACCCDNLWDYLCIKCVFYKIKRKDYFKIGIVLYEVSSLMHFVAHVEDAGDVWGRHRCSIDRPLGRDSRFFNNVSYVTSWVSCFNFLALNTLGQVLLLSFTPTDLKKEELESCPPIPDNLSTSANPLIEASLEEKDSDPTPSMRVATPRLLEFKKFGAVKVYASEGTTELSEKVSPV